MQRTCFGPWSSLALAAALLGSASAHADPVVHLAWDDCGTSVATKSFACGSNAGAQVLVISFVPPAGIDHFNGIESKLQVMGPSPGTLPDWWQFAGCRNTALGINQNFLSGPSTCADPWNGQAAGGAAFNASTGVISREVPYQSRYPFDSGFNSSCPHAYRLYPFQACWKSCRTRVAIAAFFCSLQFPS